MNTSGDAAEQIVRMSLEGTEVALRLTGAAAKNIAALLYAVLKDKDKTKTKGRQRLSAMLRSGKPLKVFSVPENQLKDFTKEAKRYGIVYCALRGKGDATDGIVDVLVRAEDAARINRVVERCHLATVDTTAPSAAVDVTDVETDQKRDDDRLVDGRPGTAPDMLEQERVSGENPTSATKAPYLSEPTSGKPQKTVEAISESRISVRSELREISENRQRERTERGMSRRTPTYRGRREQNTSHAPRRGKHEKGTVGGERIGQSAGKKRTR